MSNKPYDSFIDGIGNGLGYGLLLMCVGFFRELFGAGTLFGIVILESVNDGGWYIPNGLLLLPPSAFFIIGFLIWGLRSWKRSQVESPDFKIQTVEDH
jgi:Na+-transporting NADH:ubiquinone oxidoreductase subunit D